MNNILIGLKRFIGNKNIVTVIAVIIILGLLYWGYQSQINSSVNPVSVPVAKATIQPRTEITSDMISRIKVPKIAVSEDVITNTTNIIGKYTNINVTIPAGSMFYNGILVNKEALPDSVFTDVKEGDIPYQFAVNIETTYGNSIYPGNMIDIYMKAKDDNDQIMVGRLLENVEVLAVKDSQGKNVFEDVNDTKAPAFLLFGVPEKIHILLRKAVYLKGEGVELFPVPHGGMVPVQGDLQVDIAELENYIEARTVNLLDSDLDEATEETIPSEEEDTTVEE
ncbi:MAG: hypothetical protein IJ565_03730 [Bacilli bacterium]|nr:hypothetical protein [Bacilli bacterium]